jgi:phenylacetic acid degradation operon negative regulatory protein
MQRADQIVYNVTDLGRIAAMGGVDLAARWQRAWDGRWRQVLFDLPASRRQLRLRLWRWLRANGFGYLQNSVWIHPDPIEDVIEALAEFREDVETFLIMEASCCRGYSEQAIVAGAWDFEEINKRHRAYIETASLTGREVASFKCSPTALRSWLKRERIAWEYALQADPLLPRVLWPAEYLGERAWGVRKRSYRQLAESLAEGE